MDEEESPFIKKEDNFTRSVNSSEENNIINNNNNSINNIKLESSIKSQSKIFKKNINLKRKTEKPPEKRYDFFDERHGFYEKKKNDEITIRLVISVEEKQKENEIKKGNIKKEKKEHSESKKKTNVIIVLTIIMLCLYFGYIVKILIREGILARVNLSRVLYLDCILFVMQILMFLNNIL